MNWLKVVLGFIIMIGVLIGWFMLMKRIGGTGGTTSMKMDVGRTNRSKSRGGPNELEQIIASHRAAGGSPGQAVAGTADPRPVPATAGTTMPTVSPGRSEPSPLLAGAFKLAYLLLRTAVPELLVFAFVPASRVAGTAPNPTGGGHVFDFVLCRQDFSVVAAIDLRMPDTGTRPPAPILPAGIEYLSLDPRQLPRREHLRALLRLA
ncbi:MAG: hypothetical protein GC151_15235 [Betaproteobacteria bacterium]|nr:hypothetical protein [Betaproteobacteria bacterium]